VAVGDDEAKVRAERARAIGLFRYQLIREAADSAHSTKERGKMVRELAAREHTDPFGRRVRISRQTIDRWIRDWRAGGFDALVPSPRQCTPRTAPRAWTTKVGPTSRIQASSCDSSMSRTRSGRSRRAATK